MAHLKKQKQIISHQSYFVSMCLVVLIRTHDVLVHSALPLEPPSLHIFTNMEIVVYT